MGTFILTVKVDLAVAGSAFFFVRWGYLVSVVRGRQPAPRLPYSQRNDKE